MRFIEKDSTQPNSGSKVPQMKVLAIGLSRCATSSLQAAFESPTLDCNPCMHFARIMPHAERIQLVLDAMNEKDRGRRHAILHRLLDGYQASTDFPTWWFLEDLMDMYPDAVLVLNQRKGGGASYAQTQAATVAFLKSWPYKVVCFPIRTDRLVSRMTALIEKTRNEQFGGREVPIEERYDAFQEHALRVARARGRQVLVWKAEDGWGPLCGLLGREAPGEEVPFPRVNDSAQFQLLKRYLVLRGLAAWLAVGAGVFVASRYGTTVFGGLGTLVSGWRHYLQMESI